MKEISKLSILVSFSLIASFGIAQNPYHRILDINDGLPSNEVHDILIDSLNQIWITTDRGVCVYDGYKIKSFSTKDGLSCNTNFKIISDNYNRMWFTGYDGSLSYYEKDQFYNYKFNEVLKEELKYNWVRYLDRDENDNLFIGKEKSSVLGFNDFIQIDRYGVLKKEKYNDETIAVSNDRTHILKKRVLNSQYLYYLDNSKIPLHSFENTGRGQLFIQNKDTYEIHSRKNKKSSIKSKIYIARKENLVDFFESNLAFRFVYEDSYENIFVCSSRGLLLFKGGDISKKPIEYFKEESFTKIIQDHEGNYWASTLKKGLYFIPSFAFEIIRSDSETISSVENIETLKSHIIFRDDEKKVFDYNSKNGDCLFQFRSKSRNNHFHKCNNQLFINGQNIFTLSANDKISRVNSKYFPSQNLSIGYERNNGNILVAGEHLMIFDEGRIIFQTNNVLIKENSNKISIPKCRYEINSNVSNILEDKNNKLWFSTLEGLFSPHDENYCDILKIHDVNGLLNIRIKELKLDSFNNKWLASIGNGVLCLNDSLDVIQFSINEGLSSEIVHSIEFENDSVLWVGTNKGLDRLILTYNGFKPKLKSILNINNKDGVPSSFTNVIKYNNNNLWIGSDAGLVRLNTNHDPIPNTVPKITISEALIGKNEIDITNGQSYSYDQNDIHISYKGISYRKPEKNFYTYSLTRNSENTEWIKTDQTELRVSDLKNGQYTFIVKAKNKYDQWSDNKKLEFYIKQHFVHSWWFRISSVGIFIFFLYKLYKWRIKEIIQKENLTKSLEASKLKTQIAELTTFRNQFNPHFIFNILNSIQNFIFKSDIRKANFYLSNFGKLMRISINLMKDKYVPLQKELDFLTLYLELEFLRFPEKFEFEIEVDEELDLDFCFVPPLLFQPAIENVLKHAFNKTESGLLTVIIKRVVNKEVLSIQIIDNGTGIEFNKEKERDSYGLRLIEDRIKLLRIDFPKVNTYFKVSKTKNSNGTIAEFQIPLISKLNFNFYESNNH